MIPGLYTDRDDDEVFEQAREVEREDVVLEKGQCGARPPVEPRDSEPDGGPHSPPAAVRLGGAHA